MNLGILLSLTALSAAALAYEPLAKPAYLTSSFGENRGTRYHAGVDFSTDMQEGFPIFAPEDGVVEEVRVSPYAYGKVLYFKGESGRTWVFAHQSGFNRAIEAALRERQISKKSNDLRLAPNMKARKGDTLSYSGSTGIGNPHVHLELREGSFKLLSPCTNGVACSDTLAPQIIAFAAWTDDEVKFTSTKALEAGCAERPEGAFHAAVKIADYSRTPLENPMSIRRLEVAGAKFKFSKLQDTLSYNDMLKIRTELLWAEEADTAGDWHAIDAKIEASGTALEITAEDYLGNKTTRKVALKPACTGNEKFPLVKFQDSLLFTYLSRPFLNTKAARGALTLKDSAGKVLAEDLRETEPELFPLSRLAKKFPKASVIETAGEEIRFTTLRAGRSNDFKKKGEFALVLTDLQGASWKQTLAYRKRHTDSLDYIEFHPKGLHFTGKLEVCVEGSPETPLYYLGETTRSWFYFSKQTKSRKRRCIQMNEIRDLAAIVDTLPPRLGAPYLATAKVIGAEAPVVRIPVIEPYAGIKNGNAINAYNSGGEWIYAEFDSEPSEIVIETSLLKGGKAFKIDIEDEVGNKASYDLELPE